MVRCPKLTAVSLEKKKKRVPFWKAMSTSPIHPHAFVIALLCAKEVTCVFHTRAALAEAKIN